MTVKHEQYGLVAYICARAQVRRDVINLNQWIMPAILHEQIMFVFDKAGIPIGYWTWAYLTSDVEMQLRYHPNAVLHESEWNEGESLWIMELTAYAGYVNDIVAFIIRGANNGYEVINVRKKTENEGVQRFSRWRRKAIDDYDDRIQNSSVFRLPRSSFAISHSAWLENSQRPSTAF
jgi:hemolysin-activating ACP:hemolysin acyltransferase